MAYKHERDKAMIECRTFGHAWDRYYPIGMQRPQFGWRESLRCLRGCGTTRHDIIDTQGNVAARAYEYDADYKYPKDEMPTRSEFRLQLHKRDLADRRSQRKAS